MRMTLPPSPIPEKIIVYLDTSRDVLHAKLRLNDRLCRESINSFERLQKVARMFVMNKEAVTKEQSGKKDIEFCVMLVLGGSPTMLEFFDAKRTVHRLGQLRVQEPSDDLLDPLDMPLPLDIAEAIKAVTSGMFVHSLEKDDSMLGAKDIPELYLTRLVMFITQSRSLIKLEVTEELKKIMESPFFYVDVIYLHEEPSDDNKVKENWRTLSKLSDLQQGRGYLLESGPDVTDWHNASTLLLANPILRTPFSEQQQRKRGKAAAIEGDDDLEIITIIKAGEQQEKTEVKKL